MQSIGFNIAFGNRRQSTSKLRLRTKAAANKVRKEEDEKSKEPSHMTPGSALLQKWAAKQK